MELSKHMEETWMDVKGYEGLYKISNMGKVRSLDREFVRSDGIASRIYGRILKPGIQNSDGYLAVALTKDKKARSFSVARLVASNFIPNPDGKATVNHKKGIKTDNRVSELEWATQSENNHHAFDTGLHKRQVGESNPSVFLNEKQVRVIKWWKIINPKVTGPEVCRVFKLNSRQSVYNIWNCRNWKQVII